MEWVTLEKFKNITSGLAFNSDDAVVKLGNLVEELEKHGALAYYYYDLYSRLGKFKLKVERQVKETRMRVELEYRSGIRVNKSIPKITEGAIKALVETDADVIAEEDLLIEVISWYNRAANFATAMTQRIDLLRMLQKEKER